MLSRERAWALVTEHVQSESLRKHLLAVEAAHLALARRDDASAEVHDRGPEGRVFFCGTPGRAHPGIKIPKRLRRVKGTSLKGSR